MVTNSTEIAERVRSLRNLGGAGRYVHSEVGLNSRLDELQAAILSARPQFLPASQHATPGGRAFPYQSGIANPAIEHLAAPEDPAAHVHHLFVIRTPERDRLAEFLKLRGIETLIHYPVPAHLQECCRNIRIDNEGPSQR